MTNQNKNLCCNECFDEGVSQLSYGGCSNSKCICHTKEENGIKIGDDSSLLSQEFNPNIKITSAPSHTEEKCEHEVLPIAGEKGYVCLKCKTIIDVDIAKTDVTEPKNPEPEYDYRITGPIHTGYAAPSEIETAKSMFKAMGYKYEGTKTVPHTEGEEWVERLDEKFYWIWVNDNGIKSIKVYLREGMIPSPKISDIIKDFIRQEKKASYLEGFDAGGQTKGGTGRIMYMRGIEEGRHEKIQECLLAINKITPKSNEQIIMRNKILEYLFALTKLDETNL